MGLNTTGLSGGGLRNISEVAEFAIPDTEADQKLVHRWVLDDVDTGTATDSVGSADGTVNGVTSVSGDWAGGSAGEGDGTDDYIGTTTWGSFGSNMDSDYALAFSVSSATQDVALGVTNSGGNESQTLTARFDDDYGGNLNTLTYAVRDDTSDLGGYSSVESSTELTSGGPYRVVINKTGNTAADIDIWVNQTEDSASTNRGQSGTNFIDFNEPIPLFAGNARGTIKSFNGGILDDICVFGDSLTDTEIQSYSNPW